MNSLGHIISIQQAYQHQMSRQKALTLCKTTIRLIAELQRHRGCTLAILSGDHFFQTQLIYIQRDITTTLKIFETQANPFLSKAELQQILREWISIRQQWHKDSPQENFLLHSNLISELTRHIWNILERSNQIEQSQTQDQLLTIGFRCALHIMESAAQARGISTHLSVKQTYDQDMVSRLKFLIDQLLELDAQLSSALKELDPDVSFRIDQAKTRAEYDNHLDDFIENLNAHFIDRQTAIDADTIYTLGSHLVHSSHRILLSCIKLIEGIVNPTLDAWINGDTRSLRD